MKATITISSDEIEPMREAVSELQKPDWHCTVKAEFVEHSDGQACAVELDLSADWGLFQLGMLFEQRRRKAERLRHV